MGFWYPDNINRRDRSLQLSNDISFLQKVVEDYEKDMKTADQRMIPLINAILKKNNMKTFDELKKKLEASLTGEDRRVFEQLAKTSAAITEGTDTAFMVATIILLTSGVTRRAMPIVRFLSSGHIIVTMRAFGRAFILLLRNVDLGRAAFRAASRSAAAAADILSDAKVFRYTSRAARVLRYVEIFGLIADAFIITFSFFEERKQSQLLKDAITDLFVRRIISKYYEMMCSAIKTQDGLMLAYLSLLSGDVVPPGSQDAADIIANNMIGYVQAEWDDVTADAAYLRLIDLDTSRVSWMHEDPSRQDAVKIADSFTEDDDDKDKFITRTFGRQEPDIDSDFRFDELLAEFAEFEEKQPESIHCKNRFEVHELAKHVLEAAFTGTTNNRKIVEMISGWAPV